VHDISLTVNGLPVRRRVEGRQSLVDFVRDELELTGSHVGCEHGVCGACTMRVDGELVRGCLMLAVQAHGRRVETIEGVAGTGEIFDLQQAFAEENALQCGFCTPGMLLAAQEILARDPRAGVAEIRAGLSGNYCRCTGYHSIAEAVRHAGAARATEPERASLRPPTEVPSTRSDATEPERASLRPPTEVPSTRSDAAPVAPDSYIGRSVVRRETGRLLAGRGTYVDDIRLPRMTHVVFVRSPHAHARIVSIDVAAARALPGVVAIVTGEELARICEGWVGTLAHFAGMKSATQHALAVAKACWQGEPVVAVVAESRALAEDAAARVVIAWEPLTPVTDPETALDAATPVIHPELGDNLAFALELASGDVERAFGEADAVFSDTFRMGRHTGVTLEPRAILADFDPAERRLTVYHSFQAPNMMQDILARHLRLPEHDVRVICRDVGGSFGIKVHIYPDEMATCALSRMLGRPVKFVADRLESFQSDIHAREHRVRADIAVKRDGTILGMRLDDLTGIGPYSVYPRTSAVEGNQTVRLTPSVYRFRDYAASLRVVLQNKTPMCQYRAVGHPIAFAVMEGMVDRVARELGLDPVEVRRKNLVTADMFPHTSPTGYFFERLSLEESLEKLLAISDYADLCAERDSLRARGVYQGLGLCAFVELTTPGPAFYGVGGARISSQDACTIKLEPTGKLTCLTGVTEQGQGTDTMIAQVVASAVGVAIEDVRVLTGDTMVSPYGGGTWASRGAGIGGEAALRSGKALKTSILAVAAAILGCEPEDLDLRRGSIVDTAGEARLPLSELGRIAYFRPDTLPKDFQAELTVTRHYVPRHQGFAFTNGVQLARVQVDVETGLVTLLRHWVVEDCGRIINPRLVDEQLRGAIVQGFGAALLEHCVYDGQGQLLTTSMLDYLVPMAAEMPEIVVGHVETPTAYAEGGFKGAGEAGTAGAPGAVLNAVNDALAPFGARVTTQPITPEVMLAALGRL
jgi:carbon-monoxide dehydrogenase large subunit